MNDEKPILRRGLLPTKRVAADSKKTKYRAPAAPRSTAPKQNAVTVEIVDNAIVLRLPLIPADLRKISKSGKSIICAGTGGTKLARHLVNGALAPIEINGKNMRVCASAWISHDGVSAHSESDKDHFETGEDDNG